MADEKEMISIEGVERLNEDLKEFASTLNIGDGEIKDNAYVITLRDSDEYARVYTALDKNDELYFQADEDYSPLEDTTSTLLWQTQFYDVELFADFDNNKYTVTIREVL